MFAICFPIFGLLIHVLDSVFDVNIWGLKVIIFWVLHTKLLYVSPSRDALLCLHLEALQFQLL